MASKGMSFVDWCVRALLNTKPDVWPAEPIDASKPFKCKWQTRRAINFGKHKPEGLLKSMQVPEAHTFAFCWGCNCPECTDSHRHEFWLNAPHQPGDGCYVREALRRVPGDIEACTAPCAEYAADGRMVYVREPDPIEGGTILVEMPWRWQRNTQAARYMPRAAARMWVKIMGVRAGQVQEITPEECRAEGISPVGVNWRGKTQTTWGGRVECKYADRIEQGLYLGYALAWDVLNPKHPWASNPWHFTYDLMRTEEPQ